eukprot:2683664-Amphidinium_carterae.1
MEETPELPARAAISLVSLGKSCRFLGICNARDEVLKDFLTRAAFETDGMDAEEESKQLGIAQDYLAAP